MSAPSTAQTSDTGYVIRPNFQKKFRPVRVKEVIHQVLVDELVDQEFDANKSSKLAQHISQQIRQKLKEMDLERYKYVVQVFIGEQRGEGANMASRCLWDSDADGQAHDIFMNNSLFCVAAVFGVFYY